ncbi:hypothetical protein [Streptomyces nigrescens]
MQRASAFLFPPEAPTALPVIPPAPPYARRPLSEHVRQREQPLIGEDVALIRPYLVDHERRVRLPCIHCREQRALAA